MTTDAKKRVQELMEINKQFADRNMRDTRWGLELERQLREAKAKIARMQAERDEARVMLIYQCNDGPVAYGPFAHVDIGLAWARERMTWKDEFTIIPYHVPEYWDAGAKPK